MWVNGKCCSLLVCRIIVESEVLFLQLCLNVIAVCRFKVCVWKTHKLLNSEKIPERNQIFKICFFFMFIYLYDFFDIHICTFGCWIHNKGHAWILEASPFLFLLRMCHAEAGKWFNINHNIIFVRLNLSFLCRTAGLQDCSCRYSNV